MVGRKTKDVYCIEIDWGYGYGFEPAFECNNKISAKLVKEDCIRNGIFANKVRVKKRRLKIISNDVYYV